MVEEGTHEDLLKRGGSYFQFVRHQLSAGEKQTIEAKDAEKQSSSVTEKQLVLFADVRICGKNALQTKEHGDFVVLGIAHQGSKIAADVLSLAGPPKKA